MNRLFTYILTGALALTMAAPAMAKEHGREDRREGRERHERHEASYRRARWNDHDRDDHRGWDRGHKTGWRGGSLPPGQAKKHHDHDRDDWARDRRRRHHHHHSTYARNNGPVVIPRSNPYPTRNYPNTQTQHGRGPIPVPGATAQTTAPKPSGQGPIVVPGR